MTHNKPAVDRVKNWLLANWDDWNFVMPGNGVAMCELLNALKQNRVIWSVSRDRAVVVTALRQIREPAKKSVTRLQPAS